MIELSTSEDYKEIVNLGTIINKDFRMLYNKGSLYNEYTKILTYKIDDKIIAFIQYEELYETINIINVVVDNDYRKKGIASLLLNHFLLNVPKKTKNIMLEVREDNIPAIRLYTKYGFKVINTRKKYYNDKDAYIMERRI